MYNFDLTSIIANIPALLIAFAFHEYAHAWVADRLGDPTPRSQGRLTLNPFVHLDLFGTLLALFYRFGWAKPVMTNPRYFKGDPLRGRMLVSVAGPLANLIVAFVAILLYMLSRNFLYLSSWGITLSNILAVIVIMNVSLGIFNLLPIPPLDGFAVWSGILPYRFAKHLWNLERYGMFILLILLLTNILDRVLWPIVNLVISFYDTLATFILSPII